MQKSTLFNLLFGFAIGTGIMLLYTALCNALSPLTVVAALALLAVLSNAVILVYLHMQREPGSYHFSSVTADISDPDPLDEHEDADADADLPAPHFLTRPLLRKASQAYVQACVQAYVHEMRTHSSTSREQ